MGITHLYIGKLLCVIRMTVTIVFDMGVKKLCIFCVAGPILLFKKIFMKVAILTKIFPQTQGNFCSIS
jgi:hypothetical protein